MYLIRISPEAARTNVHEPLKRYEDSVAGLLGTLDIEVTWLLLPGRDQDGVWRLVFLIDDAWTGRLGRLDGQTDGTAKCKFCSSLLAYRSITLCIHVDRRLPPHVGTVCVASNMRWALGERVRCVYIRVECLCEDICESSVSSHMLGSDSRFHFEGLQTDLQHYAVS